MSVAVETHLLPTYPETKIGFVEGDGVWLTGTDGRRYLDFAAGIAVVSLGHRHPAPLAAAHAQLDRLWHASNLYASEPAAELAALLSDRFGGAQAFFCNSGTEANEAALKYARKATGKAGVLALEGSFHGRTLGALAVTGQPSKRAAFEPLGPARFATPNHIPSLYEAAGDDIGLVLLEPVLGEGGVIPLEPGFIAAAATLAEELGALLAFDEVQTGVGRTGTFFAWEQIGVKPQLVTLAKGLANGLPIGCLLVSDDAPRGFVPGDHGSTFGGNPVDVRCGSRRVPHRRRRAARERPRERRAPPLRPRRPPRSDRGSRRRPPRRRRARPARAAGRRRRARRRPRLPHRRPRRSSPRAAARRRRGRHRQRSRDPHGGHRMNRQQRHAAILRILRDHAVSTQTELADALHAAGHDVVQTTVSRDIHELGLIKVRDSSGRLIYAPPQAAEAERADAIAVAFARWALEVEPSGNLVVVVTPYGYASPLAQAIDVAHHPRIAGTIAGENTVLLIAREGTTGAKLAEEIRGHMLRGVA